MRSSTLVLCALLSVTACTESQDLGDRPELDGGLPESEGDGDKGPDVIEDGEGPRPENPGTGGDGSEGPVGDEEEEQGPFEFGTFEPFEAAAAGLTASAYTTIGVSSLAGATGCGVASQPEGSPGQAGARAYASVYATNGRCPVGLYALQSDEAECAVGEGEVGRDCALYQRWNEDGELEANVLATGGSVSVTLNEEHFPWLCEVELDLRFPGGRVQEVVQFEYGDAEQFCASR